MPFIKIPQNAQSTEPEYLGAWINLAWVSRIDRIMRNQLSVWGPQVVEELTRLRYRPPQDSPANIEIGGELGKQIYEAMAYLALPLQTNHKPNTAKPHQGKAA